MSESQNAASAASKKKKSASRWNKNKKGGKDSKQGARDSKRNSKRDLDDVPDLPEGAEGENDDQEIDAFVKANNEAGKKRKAEEALEKDVEMKDAVPEGEKKKKKRRKKGGKKTEGGEDKVRFLTFVGNLPYNATVELLQKHFASVNPTAVRLQTDKVTGKPKGFAFVEFGTYTDMEKALKGFHHSQFGDRKINVELTAGGGGKSKERRMKITVKNEKLNEERKKDGEKRKEKGETKKEDESLVNMDGVHPSRRARVG